MRLPIIPTVVVKTRQGKVIGGEIRGLSEHPRFSNKIHSIIETFHGFESHGTIPEKLTSELENKGWYEWSTSTKNETTFHYFSRIKPLRSNT